jgi:hypothetical protein
MEGDEVVAGEAGDRRLHLLERIRAKRVAHGIDDPFEGPIGHTVRVGLRLGDPGQRLPLEPLDVRCWKGRLAEHLREEVHDEVEVAGERVSRDRRHQGIGARAQRRSHVLERGRELERASPLGAPGEHGRRHPRHAPPIARLEESARRQARPEREGGRRAAFLDYDRDAVSERETGHLAARRLSG